MADTTKTADEAGTPKAPRFIDARRRGFLQGAGFQIRVCLRTACKQVAKENE